MPRADWTTILDIPRARKNVESEYYGDWYNDPWGWPELEHLCSVDQPLLVSHLDTAMPGQLAALDVPKANWGIRPAVVLAPLDRLAYQALVDRLSRPLIGDLHPSVYGWRLPTRDIAAGHYSHNNIQWSNYRSHLEVAALLEDAALVTDVVSCFANVDIGRMCELVEERCPLGTPRNTLVSFIQGLGTSSAGRAGLVQRSTPSAVLANLYLSVFDDILDAHATDLTAGHVLTRGAPPRRVSRRSWVRWMDDMWLFGSDASSMRRAQMELDSAARSFGLNLNTAKTAVHEGWDAYALAMEIEHSGVNAGLSRANSGPLEVLVDKILNTPEKAHRTDVKFAVRRMLDHGISYRVPDLFQALPRMPHCADILGELLASGYSQAALQELVEDQLTSTWRQFEWSTAHHLRMLDSSRDPGAAIKGFAAEQLADGNVNVQLLAACAQRLATWDRSLARSAIRTGMSRASAPHHRRILSLAALAAGETTRQVGDWLRAHRENDLTQRMLLQRRFTPCAVRADYASTG